MYILCYILAYIQHNGGCLTWEKNQLLVSTGYKNENSSFRVPWI